MAPSFSVSKVEVDEWPGIAREFVNAWPVLAATIAHFLSARLRLWAWHASVAAQSLIAPLPSRIKNPTLLSHLSDILSDL
jgi:hypothetical protein